MGKSNIRLSPKYGLNPTIPICFWCGESKDEIACLGRIGNARKGEDFEAPKYSVIDFEPCEKCKEGMALGFSVFEATEEPNEFCDREIQPGVYPTGRMFVIKNEVADKVFPKSDRVYASPFTYDTEGAYVCPKIFNSFLPKGCDLDE